MGPRWDAVHTVEDWYDGPRGGFADYLGRPHHFRSLYLDADRWNPDEDRFEVTPVPAEVVGWSRECDAILRRYYAARHASAAPADPDDDRVLPDDRVLRDELDRRIAVELAASGGRSFVVRGEFEPGYKRVRWSPECCA